MVLFPLARAVGAAGLAAGIDFTPAMLAQAAARRKTLSDEPPPEGDGSILPALVVADAAQLPFRPRCFDVVTCRYSVHHMSDPAAGLAAMASVVRAGGRIAVTDFVRPDAPGEAERHDRLEQLRGHQYVQIYTRSQLQQMMADAGCPVQDIQMTERVMDPHDWLSSPNVAPEDGGPLRALIDELADSGGGGGFDVRHVEGDLRFVRADVTLLGVKAS
jgi:SAM-dependent methyltransferase